MSHPFPPRHVVCDWSAADAGDLASRPSCARAICPGHNEVDLLPFAGLLPGNDAPSNAEFFAATLPGPDSPMPYVYDSLGYWPGCDTKIVPDALITARKADAT